MTYFKTITPVVGILAAAMAASVTIGAREQASASQGQVPAQAAQFRVIRSSCGSKGHEVGNDFVVEDPRNVFVVPQDKQIVAFFEWEGPTGLHHFQGTWRSPDGKAFSVSDFQYEAGNAHFRGYWTLTLPEAPPPGLWALEATIDGQPAGTQTFRIEIDEAHVAPKALSPAEIYQRTMPVMVTVEDLDLDGKVFSRGAGFFISQNVIATAFQNIDGASTIQILFANGTTAKLDHVDDWDRAADWALLRVGTPSERFLKRATLRREQIGDVDYLLDAPAEGGRTIQSVEITGDQNAQDRGRLLNISWAGTMQSIGSPLLNGQGEVVGMLAGNGPVNRGNAGDIISMGHGTSASVTRAPLLAVPVATLPETPREGKSERLAAMMAKGIFFLPMARDPQAITGYICDGYRIGPAGSVNPGRILNDVPHNLGKIAVVVIWKPTINKKTTVQLRIFDMQNHEVAGAKPEKIYLWSGDLVSSTWRVPITALTAGMYRMDVFAADRVQWRMFFSVVN